MKNKFEIRYRKLLNKCLKSNLERADRTGVGCYSVFNLNLKFKVDKRFPILTGRKIFEKTFNTEFNWFINGKRFFLKLSE